MWSCYINLNAIDISVMLVDISDHSKDISKETQYYFLHVFLYHPNKKLQLASEDAIAVEIEIGMLECELIAHQLTHQLKANVGAV